VASWHEPEIVVVALLEGGLHGYNATPAVRDVIKAYYDKKARSSPTPVKLAMAPHPTPRAVPGRSERMNHHRWLRDMDWPLLVLTLGLCGLGALQIYSATLDTGFRDAI